MSILWKIEKSFGTIRFGISIEKVNRILNLGLYAKGIVYLNGCIVKTLWYNDKEECLRCIEKYKILYQFYNMNDPSDLSIEELRYMLAHFENVTDREFEKFAQFIWFDGFYEFKEFVLNNHYKNQHYMQEYKPFVDCCRVFGDVAYTELYLSEVEFLSHDNELKISYTDPVLGFVTKSFKVPLHFLKCTKVSLVLTFLHKLINLKEYGFIYSYPYRVCPAAYCGGKEFLNDYLLYPTKL